MHYKLKIKSLYDEVLKKGEQKACKKAFLETFKVTESRFYATMVDPNISLPRLCFFRIHLKVDSIDALYDNSNTEFPQSSKMKLDNIPIKAE